MNQTAVASPEVTITAKSYVILALMMLNIQVGQIGFLLCLIFVDSFFGVIREVKLKAPLSWERFVWGMVSKFAILLIPFIVAWFGLVFNVDLLYVVQAFIYVIAANDLISVITNIASIRSGVRYKNVDFIEKGIHYLTSFFVNLVKLKVGKKDETD